MDIGAAIQTWIRVLTAPSEETFAQEQQSENATLGTGLLWIIISAVIGAALTFVSGLLFLNSSSSMQQMIDQMNLPPEVSDQMAGMLTDGLLTGAVGAGSFLSIILTPIFFLIGVGIYYLLARMMGGTGEYGRYAYLIAAIQAPFNVLSSVLGFVPFLGGCLAFLLWIYTLVLSYFATKVEHQLSSGQAIAVILIPIVALFLLAVCAVVGLAGMLVSLNGAQ